MSLRLKGRKVYFMREHYGQAEPVQGKISNDPIWLTIETDKGDRVPVEEKDLRFGKAEK